MNIFSFPTARQTAASPLHDEARDWLVLLTSGRATVADAKALHAWRAQSPEHAQAFEQAKALWQQLAPALQQEPNRATSAAVPSWVAQLPPRPQW